MSIQLVRNIQALFFPQSGLQFDAIKTHYQPQQVNGITYLLPYNATAVQNIIKANKYQRDHQAAQTLAIILDRYTDRFSSKALHIINVPQSYTRWRERGFDHLAEITQHSHFRSSVRMDVLKKSTHTKRQAHVSRVERMHQQAGSFRCRPVGADLCGTVILLDDVVTTGATMRAARDALRAQLHPNVRLVCLALAH